MQVRIQAVPCSYQAFGAKPLYSEIHDVKSVGEASGIAQAIYANLVAADNGQAFSLVTRAIGRKMRGFDASRRTLNFDYTPPRIEIAA